MKPKFSIKKILSIFLDGISAFLLGIYALLLGPLGVLRGPLVLERFFLYIWVLAPMGMLSRSMRMVIDWRMGNFDVAISLGEDLASKLEEALERNQRSRSKRRVLEDLFTLLTRAYMHAGHVDDAMVVVLRAKKKLGVERLPGLAELNAKTAHLVRAGLAAGRLLDGGGVATLFVKTPNQHSGEVGSINDTPQERQGASAFSDKEKNEDIDGAKIIPFPNPPEPKP